MLGFAILFLSQNQRVKECDRISAVCAGLRDIGVEVFEFEDGLEIIGNPELIPKRACIKCFADHRIAMSFGILTLKFPQITVDNPLCVNKTFPDFWNALDRFKVKLFQNNLSARGNYLDVNFNDSFDFVKQSIL